MSARAPKRFELIEPEETRLIEAAEWSYQRWGWLESVRRDTSLSTQARLVAHVLAMDFTNVKTVRCDPSYAQVAAVVGVSLDTIKRAVAALVDGGWLVRSTGRGRGHKSGYGFATRAKIVHLRRRDGDAEKGAEMQPFRGSEKGAKMPPQKGAEMQPFSDPQKGANLLEKGGKIASPYNKDKPYKNHEGASEADGEEKNFTEAARRWAQLLAPKIRDGKPVPVNSINQETAACMIACHGVSLAELDGAGLGHLLRSMAGSRTGGTDEQ